MESKMLKLTGTDGEAAYVDVACINSLNRWNTGGRGYTVVGLINGPSAYTFNVRETPEEIMKHYPYAIVSVRPTT